jgi:disulfide bond formation protein DsbB
MTRALDKKAVLAALLLGLASISAAWASQLWGGLVPCDLCWGQRVPYYWGLPVLAFVLVLWNRLPLTVWYIAIAIAAAIFAWGVYLGGYHAGVEYAWWPGPTHCTGLGEGGLTFEDVQNFGGPRVVPCDKVQFQLMGISLAGFNALISAGIVVLLGISAWYQATQVKRG